MTFFKKALTVAGLSLYEIGLFIATIKTDSMNPYFIGNLILSAAYISYLENQLDNNSNDTEKKNCCQCV